MDIGYAGALLGGLISLLSPCSVMLLPAFFSYAFASPTKLLSRTAVFYLGLAATLIPLGVFSGALGGMLTEHRTVLITVAASLVIVAGIVQLFAIPIPGLSRMGDGTADRTSAVSVFLLGTVYAVAGLCAGPVLGSVLMVAAIGGNPVYGGTLLALYALGMTIPLFVLAAVWQRFDGRWRAAVRPRSLRIGRWQNSWLMIVSGALSIGVGLLLLLTDGTASLGGLVTIGTQYRAESWISTQASRIDDLWLLLAAAVLLGIVIGLPAVWRRRKTKRRPTKSDPATAQLR